MPVPVIPPELEAEIAAVAERAECELVHVEFKGDTLRVFLDRPGGITLHDCEVVSKQLSPLLDVVDFGPGRYVLEVSSPGLDRQLYGPRDYERFVGRSARITWVPEGGSKRSVVGRLEAFLPAEEAVELMDAATGERYSIPLKEIQLARLEIEL